MGSQVTRVTGFLPVNFQPAPAFHNRLRVRHGTDRQTDFCDFRPLSPVISVTVRDKPSLIKTINKNSHTYVADRSVSVPMTLSDLEGQDAREGPMRHAR